MKTSKFLKWVLITTILFTALRIMTTEEQVTHKQNSKTFLKELISNE